MLVTAFQSEHEFVGERVSDKPSKLIRRDPFCPAAIITFGVSLTVTWVIVIAYAISRVIDLAI